MEIVNRFTENNCLRILTHLLKNLCQMNVEELKCISQNRIEVYNVSQNNCVSSELVSRCEVTLVFVAKKERHEKRKKESK